MNDALVKNAADETQVAQAQEKEKIGRDLEMEDLKKILQTEAGRRFLWRLLEQAKVFGSIMETSSRIYYMAGQQDFGHFIMGEIVEADEQSLFKMMTEANMKEKYKKIKKEKSNA